MLEKQNYVDFTTLITTSISYVKTAGNSLAYPLLSRRTKYGCRFQYRLLNNKKKMLNEYEKVTPPLS